MKMVVGQLLIKTCWGKCRKSVSGEVGYKGLEGGAWKRGVEVHAMGCMVRSAFGKPLEKSRNTAVEVREESECLCLGEWHVKEGYS